MKRKGAKVLLSFMVAFLCMCNCSMYVFAKSDSVMTKEEVMEKYSVDTGNEQADELFNTFLEHASIMATKDYKYYLKTYGDSEPLYMDPYIKYCNGTAEEWRSKDNFEKFLIDELYTTPMSVLADYSYDKSLESFQTFCEVAVAWDYNNFCKFSKDFGNAYLAIMEWQYYYMVENNAVYNFMLGEDSLGNTSVDEITQVQVEKLLEEQKKNETSEEAELDKNDTEVKTNTEESQEEEGIWDDTKESVKSSWLTFVILGVLVVALICVTVYRKSKGIDDDKVA